MEQEVIGDDQVKDLFYLISPFTIESDMLLMTTTLSFDQDVLESINLRLDQYMRQRIQAELSNIFQTIEKLQNYHLQTTACLNFISDSRSEYKVLSWSSLVQITKIQKRSKLKLGLLNYLKALELLRLVEKASLTIRGMVSDTDLNRLSLLASHLSNAQKGVYGNIVILSKKILDIKKLEAECRERMINEFIFRLSNMASPALDCLIETLKLSDENNGIDFKNLKEKIKLAPSILVEMHNSFKMICFEEIVVFNKIIPRVWNLISQQCRALAELAMQQPSLRTNLKSLIKTLYIFVSNQILTVEQVFLSETYSVKMQEGIMQTMQITIRRFISMLEFENFDFNKIVNEFHFINRYTKKIKLDQESITMLTQLYSRLAINAVTHNFKMVIGKSLKTETWQQAVNKESNEGVLHFKSFTDFQNSLNCLIQYCQSLEIEKSLTQMKLKILFDFFIRGIEMGLINGEAVKSGQVQKINSKILGWIISNYGRSN